MIKNLRFSEDLKDFKNVFKVFREHPFYEMWTEKQIDEEFDYLTQNGAIFGYYNNNEILGINTIIYGAKTEHPIVFPNNERVLYVSDIAVLENARGKGIGSLLLKNTIDMASENNLYDYIYLRTNLEGSMSEGLSKKQGFEIMKNNGIVITQDCYFKRCNESISEVDTRKFLVKTLNNSKNYWK